MTRIGLVGAGGMAAVYADRVDRMGSARVTAVASPNSAESFVAEHVPEAAAYADAAALCADAPVDAVAVLTPTHAHREAVEAAAAAGHAVICEKPLARTLAGAQAIVDAVEAAGVPLMVAHVTRFFPEYETAKQRVDGGHIGTPGVVRARRAFGFEGSRGWFDDPEKSGGVLLDLAVHDFDYLRWVFGEVERVFTRRVEWEREGRSEVSLTLLRFAGGAVGHVEAWHVEGAGVPFSTAFEFAGDEGLVEFENDVRPVRRFDDDGAHVPRDPIGDDLPLRRDAYRRQLEAFVGCAEGTRASPVPAAEGVASLRVSLAAIESAERGEPVAPREVEP
jgi:predicted dehydrogenase